MQSLLMGEGLLRDNLNWTASSLRRHISILRYLCNALERRADGEVLEAAHDNCYSTSVPVYLKISAPRGRRVMTLTAHCCVCGSVVQKAGTA